MTQYECKGCGWTGKPILMQPATRLCPSCRGIHVQKVKKA